MKRAYIAGPFRAPSAWGIEQNIRRAETLGLEVARLCLAPLIPHSMYRYFQGALPDEFWLAATLSLLWGCDALVLTDQWWTSSGTMGEIEEAKRLGLPIFSDWIDEPGFSETPGIENMIALEQWARTGQ